MRKAGWFRLWLLLTILGVPSATFWLSEQEQRVWSDLDKVTIQNCVETEFSRPDHPDALTCGHEAGADKTYFEHEHTTPLRYWSMGLGLVFLADLVITGLVVALALAIRWVVNRPSDAGSASRSSLQRKLWKDRPASGVRPAEYVLT